MYHRVLLAASLLSACSGETSANGPTETVYAFAGEDVVLPCSFNITSSDDFPTVEWSKEGLQPNVIFLYRDGCETYEMKHPAFHYRTSFITKEMKNRNISLRISNVQLSDAGKYRCMRLWKNAPRDITTVELVVGAVSEPKLSMVPAESGGVTLLCEATCWLPEPEIKFLDHQGNNITADNPSRRQDGSGCYTVTRRVTLQDATHRVTCSVHQPEINQTRVAQIHIPVDCMQPCSLSTGIAVGEAVLLLLALTCGLTVLVKTRCRKSGKGPTFPMSRQTSEQSTVSTPNGSCEHQPFLQTVRVDSDETGKLKREIADLKSKLREKEETIHRLQNNNPPISPVVQLGSPTMFFSLGASANSNRPEPGNVPQTRGPKPRLSQQNSVQEPDRPKQRNRIKSSPAIFVFDEAVPSSSNASKKKLGRCNSDRVACPDPKVPKTQRRHSSSSSYNHRYTPLAGLPEETELLISLEKSTPFVTKM
ncbi:butyrophilin subfamily 3 member A2-like [Acanthopagrus latus]|uniref:butyrophilin subfamily 3 member A2-like n=1 Tax=Acanthopagrus latus TaxID=8177 RepID=UPI00187C8170|nr:butyrophilin subfamily 3 member A2-like [Acanthopagrus latus]